MEGRGTQGSSGAGGNSGNDGFGGRALRPGMAGQLGAGGQARTQPGMTGRLGGTGAQFPEPVLGPEGHTPSAPKLNNSMRTLLLLVYALILPLTARWVFALDERLALVIYFALLLPLFFLFRWPNAPGMLMAGFLTMLIGKLSYAVTVNPLNGPDETHYYEQVVSFERLSQFLPYAMEHFQTQWANISAYPVFGMLYMPFYKWLEIEDPLAITLLNTVLLILVVNRTYRLNEKYFGYTLPDSDKSRHLFYVVAVFGLLVSPCMMFMSSLFAKDVFCVLLGLYGATLLLERRWILFLLVLAYSTGLRDYALVYTFGFYFLYAGKLKTSIGVLGAAALLIVWQIGPLGMINAGMLSVFLFMSPNPMNPGNWEPKTLLRTIEAVYMTVVLMLSVYQFVKYKETRRFYLIAAIMLFTYACALVLVGYVTVTGRDLEYGVGTIGDNMVRKKLPVIPLLYTISAYTLVWCFKPFMVKRQKIATTPHGVDGELVEGTGGTASGAAASSLR
ncbi:hypothetical protein ACFO9Q_03580 [Paenibacillus sp. GCM10023252]|uniref:hypothetical protein n=1 Tax=Paenibacillus sp. GCM10023252 TaxID=3252649 RepID=UPI00360F39AB